MLVMKRTDSNDPLINFRTPLDKKLLADALARRRGFKNVSDLMNALLNAAIDDEWSKVELEALLKMISPTDPKAKGRNNKAA